MDDITISLRIGSPHSTLTNVKYTIESILENIGTENFSLMISLDSAMNDEIKDYVHHIPERRGHIFEGRENNGGSWAEIINDHIDKADAKYFLISHDDIQLQTPDFYHKVDSILQKTGPVGWVSFTDTDYLNGHFFAPTRPGFHTDYLFEKGEQRRKLSQFHNLPDNWWEPYKYQAMSLSDDKREEARQYYTNLSYDFPDRPVKCHTPWSIFFLIEMEQLKKIGKCEDWGTGAPLLVEEDWGLRAMQIGLFNIWIPDIKYRHIRTMPWQQDGGARCSDMIGEYNKKMAELFYEKWHFHSPPTKDELETIKNEYGDTNIPWSIGERSYDWDYI